MSSRRAQRRARGRPDDPLGDCPVCDRTLRLDNRGRIRRHDQLGVLARGSASDAGAAPAAAGRRATPRETNHPCTWHGEGHRGGAGRRGSSAASRPQHKRLEARGLAFDATADRQQRQPEQHRADQA